MSSLAEIDPQCLRAEHNLECFVETGCFMGDGIATALAAGFQDIYSCDIDLVQIEHCRSRFPGDRRVRLWLGESVDVLPEMCADAKAPALFWLDAHFPAHYGLEETERNRFPLKAELEIIAARRQPDVVAFDDLRVICAGDNPRWREGAIPDYYVVRGGTLAELIAPFARTHDFRCIEAAEGIGLLIPKCLPAT